MLQNFGESAAVVGLPFGICCGSCVLSRRNVGARRQRGFSIDERCSGRAFVSCLSVRGTWAECPRNAGNGFFSGGNLSSGIVDDGNCMFCGSTGRLGLLVCAVSSGRVPAVCENEAGRAAAGSLYNESDPGRQRFSDICPYAQNGFSDAISYMNLSEGGLVIDSIHYNGKAGISCIWK